MKYHKYTKTNEKSKNTNTKQANNVVNYFNDLSLSLKNHLNNPKKNFEEDEQW